jgi:hypothetical protein
VIDKILPTLKASNNQSTDVARLQRAVELLIISGGLRLRLNPPLYYLSPSATKSKNTSGESVRADCELKITNYELQNYESKKAFF